MRQHLIVAFRQAKCLVPVVLQQLRFGLEYRVFAAGLLIEVVDYQDTHESTRPKAVRYPVVRPRFELAERLQP